MRGFVSVEGLFAGRHFDRQVIILCVSWYASFKLSFRDLVIMMADRGISLAHTTILRRFCIITEKPVNKGPVALQISSANYAPYSRQNVSFCRLFQRPPPKLQPNQNAVSSLNGRRRPSA